MLLLLAGVKDGALVSRRTDAAVVSRSKRWCSS